MADITALMVIMLVTLRDTDMVTDTDMDMVTYMAMEMAQVMHRLPAMAPRRQMGAHTGRPGRTMLDSGI
jgi:hypothetical protein